MTTIIGHHRLGKHWNDLALIFLPSTLSLYMSYIDLREDTTTIASVLTSINFKGDEYASIQDPIIRRLPDIFCYDQMLQNGYFKEIGGSLSLWYGEDVHPNANSVQAVKFRESHVVIVTYRRNVFSCIKQNIARAIPCLSGSGFYLRVMADVLMVDPWNYLFLCYLSISPLADTPRLGCY